jgi:hypothetical protein
MVFEAEHIGLWRDKDVIDLDGGKIGTLESVYVDTADDEPFIAGVKTGIIGRHKITFVPLAGATVGPGYVRVRFDKDLVKNAPTIDVDGELAATEEPAIFTHYSLPYNAGPSGGRRLARR